MTNQESIALTDGASNRAQWSFPDSDIGPEQSISHFGITLDVGGIEKDFLSPGFAEWVHAAWPRYDLGFAIAEAIARDIRSNPSKAPPSRFQLT